MQPSPTLSRSKRRSRRRPRPPRACARSTRSRRSLRGPATPSARSRSRTKRACDRRRPSGIPRLIAVVAAHARTLSLLRHRFRRRRSNSCSRRRASTGRAATRPARQRRSPASACASIGWARRKTRSPRCLSALESARELGLAALEINIHNSLGSVFLASGRSDDAERHLAARRRARHRAGQQEPPDEARAQPDAPRPEARRPGARTGRSRSASTRPASRCRSRH